jgi:hypothetical protein
LRAINNLEQSCNGKEADGEPHNLCIDRGVAINEHCNQ